MKSFVALLKAGFYEFVRNRTAVFFTLVFPMMFVLLFGVFFGQQGDSATYAVGVVLEDEKDVAALGFFCTFESVDRREDDEPALNANDVAVCQPWFEHTLASAGSASGTPSPFAETLELPLFIYRGTLDEEMEQLRNADRHAVVVFPAGFGDQVQRALVEDRAAANVEIHFDASQTNTAQIVTQILSSLLDAYDRQLSGTNAVIGADLKTITAEGFNYMNYFVPGVVAMALMQLGIFGSLTMVSLRERKILKRLGATPLPRRTLVQSQAGLRLGIAVVQTYIILAVGAVLFDVQVANQFGFSLFFILLGGLAFIAIGYVVASFARTEAAGSAIVQVIQFPMMFLSGIFWPLEFAPDWLQPIVKIMPLTYLGDALRQVMVEGSSALNPLWVNAVVLMGWLVVSMLISFKYFRWE